MITKMLIGLIKALNVPPGTTRGMGADKYVYGAIECERWC